ncbi:Mitochondrial ribosomal protein subunit domain containing protein [Rhypophila sp. PSN 637]
MATARSVSPGGALLRASRLFSIPTPLPPCPTVGAEAPRSNTATKNYPTHQAITTSGAARKVGDWGLKRPLPLGKTTKSGQAMVRVKAIDSVEQITDYSSATDHGITLQKFQELRLPLSYPAAQADGRARRGLNIPMKSVFDEDSTDRNAGIATKWKFEGPWLAGMTLGDFNKWVEKQVKPRRIEFHAFLKGKIASRRLESAKKAALERGERIPDVMDTASITDDHVTDYLQELRSSGNYQELYDTVGEFLDLAPVAPPDLSDMVLRPFQRGSQTFFGSNGATDRKALELKTSPNPYEKHGPPPSHPSAGISYLRTNMYLDNHPVYGPQDVHPPVQARVLRPKTKGIQGTSKIGVAGFVAANPFGDTTSNLPAHQKSIAKDALLSFDPTIEGGAKLWVHPKYAFVDSYGRVRPVFEDVQNEQSRLVALESVGEAKVFGEKNEPPARLSGAERIRNIYKSKISSAESYAPHQAVKMGRVRTKTVKKSAKVIIERYYPKLTLDFETNKRICDEIAIIASKRLRNKIAGYTTHLMKRISRGPVRGISFKLQEEERERKDQYVPEISALDFAQNSESGQLDVDTETKDLLKHLGFDSIPVNVVPVTQAQAPERGRRFGDRPPRRD